MFFFFLLDFLILGLSFETYRNLLDVIVSGLPFLNHFTSIGWSPVTLHCKMAVSPSLEDTVREVDENSGEAANERQIALDVSVRNIVIYI